MERASGGVATSEHRQLIGAYLRVDVRVDAQQHLHRRVGALCCCDDVVQVELRVHIDQHSLPGSLLQLPGQLTISI